MKHLIRNNKIRITFEQKKEFHTTWDLFIRFIFVFLFGAEIVMPVFNSTAALSKSIDISRAIAAGATVLVVSTIVTILILILEDKFKRFWVFAGGFFVLAAAIGAIFNKAIRSGGIVFYNSLLANWNQKYGSIVYFIDAETGAETLCMCLMLGLAAVVLTVLALIMIKYRRFIELTVFSLLLFFAEVMAASSAPVWAAIWTGLAVLLYVIFIDAEKKLLEGKRAYYLVIVIITAVFSAIVILTGFLADGLLSDMQEKIISAVENHFYDNIDASEGNLPLESSHSTSDSIKIMVEGLGSESLYLRGFIGSEYTGTKWVDLDDSAYKNNSDSQNLSMFQKLSETFTIDGQEFTYTPLTSLSIAWEILEERGLVSSEESDYQPTQKTYMILNQSASNKYIYTPYGMNTFYAMDQETASDYDGTIPAENKDLNYKNGFFSKTESYMVSVYSIDPLDYAEIVGTDWKELTNDPELSEFIIREQNYSDYCDEHYTSVAGELYKGDAEAFESYIKGLVDTSSEESVLEATNEIREYLRNTLTYTDEAHSTYGGVDAVSADYVENLVENDKCGHSVQYATLATLLFRAKGIPARYVEGYFLSKGVIDGVNDNNGMVEAADAHAWVEVYRYGYGWVPVEVTPGFYEDKNPGYNEDEQVQQEENDSSEDEEETTSPEEDENEPVDNSLGKLIFVILIIIFVILIAIILRRILILYFRKKKINSDDKRKSLKAISAIIVKNSRLAGIKLREDIPIESAEAMDAFVAAHGGVRFEPVAKAMGHAFYSSTGPTDADVIIAKKYMEAEIRAIYEPANWREKFKLKYIIVIC